MTKKHLMAGILSLGLVMLFALPLVVNGQADTNFGLENVNIGLGRADLIDVVNAVIRIILGVLGVIAVVIILVGGFEWMTAGGNAEKVTKAQTRIVQGVIGLVIIFLAYAIANFVITRLANVTNAG